MRNRRSAKKAGTQFESAIAKYLCESLGYPIERRAKCGKSDKGDIAGVFIGGKQVVIECKNEKNPSFPRYINELNKECENASSDFGIVVFKRGGIGLSSNDSIGRHGVLTTTEYFYLFEKFFEKTSEINCTELKYNGKYDVKEIMDIVEKTNESCDLTILKQQSRNGDSFIFTTLNQFIDTVKKIK